MKKVLGYSMMFNFKKTFSKKQVILLLTILLIIGVGLRFYSINTQSIWLDEGFSVYFAKQSVVGILNINDPTPPLYNLLLHFWMNFFGDSETAIRSLSLIFGLLCIIISYNVAKLLVGQKAALLTALLTTFMPLQIYFSQEARPYILFWFLSLCSMYFYIKILNKMSNKEQSLTIGLDKLGYIIATALMLYSHGFAMFIFLTQNIHYFYINLIPLLNKLRKNKKQFLKLVLDWILLQFLIILLWLPWILKLPKIINDSAYRWITLKSIVDVSTLPYAFLSGGYFSLAGTLLMILGLYFFIGEIIRFKKEYKNPSINILYAWLILPIVFSIILSFLLHPIFTAKYIFMLSFPYYIIISFHISKIKKEHAAVFIILLLSFSIWETIQMNNHVLKNNWKDASNYSINLANNPSNDQAINFFNSTNTTTKTTTKKIIVFDSFEALPLLYYVNRTCLSMPTYEECAKNNGIYPVHTYEEFKNFSSSNMVIIFSSEQYNKDYGQIKNFIDANYFISSTKYFTKVDEYNITVLELNKK